MKGIELLRRYPVSSSSVVCFENSESLEQHTKAISNELSKLKPRDTVLLPLIKSTYNERRMFILNEATCVDSILE